MPNVVILSGDPSLALDWLQQSRDPIRRLLRVLEGGAVGPLFFLAIPVLKEIVIVQNDLQIIQQTSKVSAY